MPWIPYPRQGTQVLDGRWLCTVQFGRRYRQTEILDLEGGCWYRDKKPLSGREKVVAIDFVPDPYKGA